MGASWHMGALYDLYTSTLFITACDPDLRARRRTMRVFLFLGPCCFSRGRDSRTRVGVCAAGDAWMTRRAWPWVRRVRLR